MTTFTTEDKNNSYPKIGSHWLSTSHERFEVLAITNPNEEPDPWVTYKSLASEQLFSCRLPAFTSRFSLTE